MRLVMASLVLCVLCASASPGVAGAWPQTAGAYFVSATTRMSRPQNDLRAGQVATYTTLYVEYGVTDRLTMGVDLGRSVSGAEKAVVFLRYPLPSRWETVKLSAEIGIGRIDDARVLRPGFSLGTSFPVRDDIYGWLSVETIAEIDRRSGAVDYKLDATVGVTLPSERKFFVQVQSGAPHDRESFLRIEPTMVFPAGKDRHLEVGVTVGLRGDDQLGLKLGLWQKF